MAFILVDHRAAASRAVSPADRPPRAATPPGGKERRIDIGAVIASLAVHGLLLLMIIGGLFGKAPEGQDRRQAGGSLVVFDLPAAASLDRSEAAAPALQEQKQAAATVPPARAEWSERKILMPADGAAHAPARAAEGAAGGVGGQDAGPVASFDPYAGAAPMRAWNVASADAAPAPVSTGQNDVNLVLGGKLVAMARSRWPGLSGTCVFTLVLDEHGRIALVRWKGGSLPERDREKLKLLLADKGLGQVGPSRAALTLGPLFF